MGIVVPLWIWLPVVLYVMWKYERRQKQRLLEMRWVDSSNEQGLVSSSEPQLLLGERVVVRRGSSMMEMRSMMIVAVLGLLSAWMYAREPSSVGEGVIAANAQASPAGTAAPYWTSPHGTLGGAPTIPVAGGAAVAPGQAPAGAQPWVPPSVAAPVAAATQVPPIGGQAAAVVQPAPQRSPRDVNDVVRTYPPPEVSRAPNLNLNLYPSPNPTPVPGNR
jgi:hypothetical protein